jgi:hypothetical protein
MRAEDAGRWNGGRLYNPEDGRDYKGSLHLQSPTRLVIEGCALFICKQQIWRRVDAGRCPPVERWLAAASGKLSGDGPCEFTRNSQAVWLGFEIAVKSVHFAPKRWQLPPWASLPALNKLSTL